MILLLGGTSETAPLAEALAKAGYDVLVSTATDVPLNVGDNSRISHRRGRLPEAEMIALIRDRSICAIVNAAHPYATHVRATAQRVAAALEIPCFTFDRPAMAADGDGACIVATHEEAARVACAEKKTVLLTVGSRNVAIYAAEARRTGVRLVARVLDHADSLDACLAAGLAEGDIVSGRGPFSVEENRALIREISAGVLVTKDSGEAGGFPEKLEAAQLDGCRVVVVGRPEKAGGLVFDNFAKLMDAVRASVNPRTAKHAESLDVMNSTPLILLAHGSKNPQWLAPFEHLTNDLRHEVGSDRVFLCYMELASPSLLDVAAELAKQGAKRCRLLPMFMARGNHYEQDIPAQIQDLKQRYPSLDIELMPPIGQHPRFLNLMRELARECGQL